MTSADAGSEPPGEQSLRRRPLPEWQARLRASPGFRAIGLQDMVKRMGYVFQQNAAEYRSLVARLQDPSVSLPIMDVHNRDMHDDLLSEAERLLHNVLTAMSTRVDQQRRFVNQHFGDDPVLTKEYTDRIASSFTPSPDAAFLKGLRNFMTHRQLPVAQSKQTLRPDSFEVTFILPTAPLLDWDGWNNTVREWIVGQGEAVPIVNVIDAYARITGQFDQWLHARIGLKYRTEIQALRVEQQEYNREVERIFGRQRTNGLIGRTAAPLSLAIEDHGPRHSGPQ